MHAPPTAAKCFDRSCLLIITLKLERYRPTNRYNIDLLIRSLSVAFDEKISISLNNRTSIQIILVHATLKLIQSFDELKRGFLLILYLQLSFVCFLER